jgi:hypothetical protein
MPQVEPATLVKGATDYAGTYAGSDDRKLQFVADGERLYLLHADQRVPVETLSVPGLLARHPDFGRFPLTFTRASGSEAGPFTDVAYGGDCYTRGGAQRPAQKAVPAIWRGFTGYYRNDSPWFGSVRIALRRDRLWALYALGYEFPLEPLGDRTFRLADSPNNADWIQFMDDVNGQATHLSVSGEPFWRRSVP